MIRPIIATRTITYYPAPYFEYCEYSGDIEPTEEGFLEFIETDLVLDFAALRVAEVDVEFMDPPEGEE